MVETTAKSLNNLSETDWHIVFDNGDKWIGLLTGGEGKYIWSNANAIEGCLIKDFVLGDKK